MSAGGVGGAGGVVLERTRSAGGVVAAGGVVKEHLMPAGGVAVAGGVGLERFPTGGGVEAAGGVGGERIAAQRRVVRTRYRVGTLAGQCGCLCRNGGGVGRDGGRVGCDGTRVCSDQRDDVLTLHRVRLFGDQRPGDRGENLARREHLALHYHLEVAVQARKESRIVATGGGRPAAELHAEGAFVIQRHACVAFGIKSRTARQGPENAEFQIHGARQRAAHGVREATRVGAVMRNRRPSTRDQQPQEAEGQRQAQRGGPDPAGRKSVPDNVGGRRGSVHGGSF